MRPPKGTSQQARVSNLLARMDAWRPDRGDPAHREQNLRILIRSAFWVNTSGLFAWVILLGFTPVAQQHPALYWLFLILCGASATFVSVMSCWYRLLDRPALSRAMVAYTNFLLTITIIALLPTVDLALSTCGWFFLLGIYVALAHDHRTLLPHTLWGLTMIAVVTVYALVSTDTPVMSVAASTLMLSLFTIYPPLLVWFCVRALRHHVTDLHDQATRDALTGTLNRRGLSAALPKLLHQADLQRQHAVVASVDIDRFKAVNDAHGHHVGDQLLVTIANNLSSAISPHGFVARVGGEEFVVADIVEPGQTLSRIRHLREAGAARATGRVAVTTSVGAIVRAIPKPTDVLADLPEPNEGTTGLLVHADTAMYAAKRAGGNREVIYHEQHLERGHREVLNDHAHHGRWG